jgi:hypothetical protein
MTSLYKPKYHQIVDIILTPILEEHGLVNDWQENSEFMIGLRQASIAYQYLPEKDFNTILNAMDFIANTSEDYKDGFRTMTKSLKQREAGPQ